MNTGSAVYAKYRSAGATTVGCLILGGLTLRIEPLYQFIWQLIYITSFIRRFGSVDLIGWFLSITVGQIPAGYVRAPDS